MHRQDNPVVPAPENKKPATLDSVPRRVGEIAMLRGLGYSYRVIGRQFGVTPQAVSLMLTRHRRSLNSLRGAVELSSLSARAVNALGRHGVHTREEAQEANVLELLAGERNCGNKTIDEITRWINNDTQSLPVNRP